MWKLVYETAAGRVSVHLDKVRAITAACQLVNAGYEVKEVSKLGDADSERVELDSVKKLARAMRQRGIDVPTAALIAATLGALLLVLIPGDQVGHLLAIALAAALS